MFKGIKGKLWLASPIKNGKVPADISDTIYKAIAKKNSKNVSVLHAEATTGDCIGSMIKERERLEAILYKDTDNFVRNLKQLVTLDENISGLIGEVAD